MAGGPAVLDFGFWDERDLPNFPVAVLTTVVGVRGIVDSTGFSGLDTPGKAGISLTVAGSVWLVQAAKTAAAKKTAKIVREGMIIIDACRIAAARRPAAGISFDVPGGRRIKRKSRRAPMLETQQSCNPLIFRPNGVKSVHGRVDAFSQQAVHGIGG